MGTIFSSAYSLVSSGYCSLKNSTLDNFNRATAVVNDINGCTKLFRVVISSLKLAHLCEHIPLPTKVLFVLDTVNLNDSFYDIITFPKANLFPVTAERIDTNKLYKRICLSLAPDNGVQLMKPDAIKAIISAFVREMHKNGIAYRDTNELADALTARFNSVMNAKFKIENESNGDKKAVYIPWGGNKDNVLGREIQLTKMSWSKSLSGWNAFGLTSGCVLHYLRDWSLLDPNQMVGQQALGVAIRASIVSLYALKALILFNDWDLPEIRPNGECPNPIQQDTYDANKVQYEVKNMFKNEISYEVRNTTTRLADRVNVIADLTSHSLHLVDEVVDYLGISQIPLLGINKVPVFPEKLLLGASIMANLIGLKCIWSGK